MSKLNRTITINREHLKTFASKTPQVCVLAKMIGEFKKDQVDEETVEKTVKSAKWGTELKTRQDPYLIFRYYRKTFEDAGVLVVQGKQNTRILTPEQCKTCTDYDVIAKAA